MVKATEVVYKYVEGGFAVKHKKDGFKASSIGGFNWLPFYIERIHNLVRKRGHFLFVGFFDVVETEAM